MIARSLIPRSATLALIGVLFAAALTTGCVQFGWDRLSTQVPKAVVDLLQPEGLSAEQEGLSEALPGQRSAFSDDERKTLQYLGRRMAQLGLVPAGDDGFLQEVPLNAIRIESASLRVGSFVFTQGEDLALWSRSGEAEIALEAGLVFVGHGVVAPERERDDYSGLDLKDKIALILAGPSDSSYVDTWYADWRYQCAEAARHGAAGVLLVHPGDASGAGSGAHISTGTWGETVARFTRFQLALRIEESDALPFEAWIPAHRGNELLTSVDIDPAMARSAASSAGFRGRELPLMVSVQLEASVRATRSFNLVGQIPGRYSEEQSVLLGASWDGGEEQLRACASLLQVAMAFRSLAEDPARSVVVSFFALSEREQLGAEAYARRPARDLDQCAGAIIFDGGLHIVADTLVVGGSLDNELGRLVSAAALEDGLASRNERDAARWMLTAAPALALCGLPAVSMGGEVEDQRAALRVGFHMAQTRGSIRWDQYSTFRFFPRTKK